MNKEAIIHICTSGFERVSCARGEGMGKPHGEICVKLTGGGCMHRAAVTDPFQAQEIVNANNRTIELESKLKEERSWLNYWINNALHTK